MAWSRRVRGSFKQHVPHPTRHSNVGSAPLVDFSFSYGNPPPRVAISTGRSIDVSYLHQDPDSRLMITITGHELDLSDASEMQWVMGYLLPAWNLLSPLFAFADRDTSLARSIDAHPERLAWPWMIYGPEMIAKWGEEHLRKAPVWRVEKLDYGGMLLQVAENPFTATRRQVKALADHLGLEAPR